MKIPVGCPSSRPPTTSGHPKWGPLSFGEREMNFSSSRSRLCSSCAPQASMSDTALSRILKLLTWQAGQGGNSTSQSEALRKSKKQDSGRIDHLKKKKQQNLLPHNFLSALHCSRAVHNEVMLFFSSHPLTPTELFSL